MSIRIAVATAGLIVAGAGAASAQTSYANPYGYAYPQQPYGTGYPQQGYSQGNPYAPANAYGQAYAPSYPQQGYGAATYVQPYYGSPYAPQAADPFPEQPARATYQQPESPTVIVSGGGIQMLGGAAAMPASTAPVETAPPAQARVEPARVEPARSAPLPGPEPVPSEPIAVEPAPATMAATGAVGAASEKPQAPAGTFDQLYAARYEQPQVAEWKPDPHEGYGGWLSEVRIGLLEHDAGLWSGKKEDGLDINGEVLFTSPGFLDIIFSPRPTIGGSIHTEGETNVVYFGLTWEWNVTPWLYVEGQWGPAFHDGNLTGQTADKKGYGCSVLSRGSAAIGLRYEHHSIQAFYSHMSNGDICDENDGIDAGGIRYGYRF